LAITQTFSEAFDEIFNIIKQLYRHPKSFRPSMKKERLPLETVIEGVSILLSLSSEDNIIVSLNKHPKTKPIHQALKKAAWKHNLNLEKNKLTSTNIELFKLKRGYFIINMNSQVLSTEEKKKIAEETLQLYLQRTKAQPTLKLSHPLSN